MITTSTLAYMGIGTFVFMMLMFWMMSHYQSKKVIALLDVGLDAISKIAPVVLKDPTPAVIDTWWERILECAHQGVLYAQQLEKTGKVVKKEDAFKAAVDATITILGGKGVSGEEIARYRTMIELAVEVAVGVYNKTRDYLDSKKKSASTT